MLLSVLLLVSCGKKTGSNDTEGYAPDTLSPEQAEESRYLETYDPSLTAQDYDREEQYKDKNYNGHAFTFLNSGPVYYMYIYLDPDMTGDVLDNTCWKRNNQVEKELNITITEETQPYSDLASYAKTLIFADEDVYDAMYIPCADLTPLISENLFYDLMEIDELGLDNIWWDQPLITRNIIEDRLFYATSDMHLMAFDGIWCMYFNEGMMEDLGLELPFELALSGKWTFDELKKYCSAAANLNGDASFVFDVAGNANYGMVSMGGGTYLAYGMETEYVARDENGRYQFTAHDNPKFTDTWTKLIDFYGPDNGLFVYGNAEDLAADGYYRIFMENRALFLHAELKGATMLREWPGKFGLMPQPKYDVNQENYNSNIFNSCLSFCIPNTNTELERTGIIVDYLTYLSYVDLMPRYYDIHVSLKALGRQESKDVLAIIRGTRGCEVATPFGWVEGLGDAMSTLVKNNEHSIASTVESYKNQVIEKINETYAEYPSLKHVEE